jgi:hypothetical protein
VHAASIFSFGDKTENQSAQEKNRKPTAGINWDRRFFSPLGAVHNFVCKITDACGDTTNIVAEQARNVGAMNAGLASDLEQGRPGRVEIPRDRRGDGDFR